MRQATTKQTSADQLRQMSDSKELADHLILHNTSGGLGGCLFVVQSDGQAALHAGGGVLVERALGGDLIDGLVKRRKLGLCVF